jgi:CRISPR system Cascade subunit CasA
MRASFQVLDQGWIPVITADGKERQLGIRQTLLQAHLLREISCASPLEEYSIYRFLGLFLMDALRPESELDIEDLLEQGRFSEAEIEKYISVCQAEGVSFDLFDEERPFLQSLIDPTIEKEIKPTSVLDCTLPSGNNHTHFVHGAVGRELQPEAAMRLLLATYLFCTAAAQGYPSGVYASPPYFSVIKGRNLFEALTYTLLPTDSIGIPFDKPPVLWRRTEPIIPKREIGSTSWLQGMLFPTRRIHLIPNENGQVTGVYLCQGENFINKESWRDPYAAYRKNDQTVFPLRPSADRALWRNLCDIVDIPGGRASVLLEQYRRLCPDSRVGMTLYGAETSQASYLGIYRHDLSFPLSLTENDASVELLSVSIAASEELAKSLKQALVNTNVLREGEAVQAVQGYYRRCEARFWALCEEAAETADRKQLYQSFCADVCAFADRCFTEQISRKNLRASALAAAAVQRDKLGKTIRKIQKEASQ